MERLLHGEKRVSAGEMRKRRKWPRDKRRLAIAEGLLRDLVVVVGGEIDNGNLEDAHGGFALELIAGRIRGIARYFGQTARKRKKSGIKKDGK